MFDLVAIGNPVYDIVKTPFAESLGRILSGCSVNAALTAKRLGMKRVAVLGCVSEEFRDKLVEELRRQGVEVIVAKTSKETTGFKLRYLDFSGNRELEVLGVAGRIYVEDLPRQVFESKAALIGPVLGEVDVKVLVELKRRGSKIYLDPQGFVRRERKGVVEHYNNPEAWLACEESHVVKPNELEAKILTGEDEPLKAAITIYEKTGALTIVTLAERGSIVVDGERAIIVPAYRTHLVDPTGAGDVYLGAFAFCLSQGMSLEDAASTASAVASIKVEHIAAHFNLDLKDVEKRSLWVKARLKVKKLR